jgi:hypothetical protein
MTLVNDADAMRVLTVDAGSVEQHPVESDPGYVPGDRGPAPAPYIKIQAPDGASAAALVRFRDRGEFEAQVETPGRPETRRTLTIVVR